MKNILFQIDLFESLYKEIDDLDNFQVLDCWLRVDARPFKHALLNTCAKWGYMFKEHLVKYVTNSLSELARTIRSVLHLNKSPLDNIRQNGLKKPPKNADLYALTHKIHISRFFSV